MVLGRSDVALLTVAAVILALIAMKVFMTRVRLPQNPAGPAAIHQDVRQGSSDDPVFWESAGADRLPWGLDPFREFPGAVDSGDAPAIDASRAFELTGITWGRQEAAAIVNDMIVRRGDRLEGWLVKEIFPDRVVLERAGDVLELRQKGGDQ